MSIEKLSVGKHGKVLVAWGIGNLWVPIEIGQMIDDYNSLARLNIRGYDKILVFLYKNFFDKLRDKIDEKIAELKND